MRDGGVYAKGKEVHLCCKNAGVGQVKFFSAAQVEFTNSNSGLAVYEFGSPALSMPGLPYQSEVIEIGIQ